MRIESLLAARLFLSPQRARDRLYFISNLSGKLSLYAMDTGGSVPEPLLPPNIALQNPTLMTGYSYYLLPELDKLLVMIDANGDENYQPMLVPMSGGIPEPAFGEQFRGYRVHLEKCYPADGIAYFAAESRSAQLVEAFQARLGPAWSLTRLAGSPWGELGHRSGYVNAVNTEHSKVLLREGYTLGDNLLRLWEKGKAEPALVYGKPLEERGPGESVPLAGIFNCHFTKGDRGLLFVTALFEDHFGLGFLGLDGEQAIRPVRVGEPRHTGYGELYKLDHLQDDRFVIQYNIDGCSWGYEGTFDEARLEMKLKQVLWGQGELSQGVLEADHYDQHSDSYSLAFSTATSPAQIYTLDGPNRDRLAAHTRERVLGIPQQWMARGEDA
ncbi:MAG TPA: S9 family peptidase, partial [Anaerolineales bacterium]|nr:S9 family peptidase [Anaerolineales bacterium]